MSQLPAWRRAGGGAGRAQELLPDAAADGLPPGAQPAIGPPNTHPLGLTSAKQGKHCYSTRLGTQELPVCTVWPTTAPGDIIIFCGTGTVHGVGLAVGETAILLTPPLPSVGVSTVVERGCQQNDMQSRRRLGRSVAVGLAAPIGHLDLHQPQLRLAGNRHEVPQGPPRAQALRQNLRAKRRLRRCTIHFHAFCLQLYSWHAKPLQALVWSSERKNA